MEPESRPDRQNGAMRIDSPTALGLELVMNKTWVSHGGLLVQFYITSNGEVTEVWSTI